MAALEAVYVRCLAVSQDGRWIAAGTFYGEVFVWSAKTLHENVLSDRVGYYINGIDFSPDSSRLVSTSGKTASVWDIATRQRVRTFDHWHGDWSTVTKYSPQGDRIATATEDSGIRVWDTNDGRLLRHIEVTVTPQFNNGLLWFNDHLLVISDSTIKQFEASTGSTVSEWPVPGSTPYSCMALPKHGAFIAYATQRTVTFWGTATHTQLDLIQHAQDIRSITLSPDDRFLAIGAEDGNITINSLSRIVVSILSRCTGAYQLLFCSHHFSTLFIPFLSFTPHIPGTRHSHRRCRPPLLEAKSIHDHGSFIDRSNRRVSQSKS